MINVAATRSGRPNARRFSTGIPPCRNARRLGPRPPIAARRCRRVIALQAPGATAASTEDDIRDLRPNLMAAYKCPSMVEFVDALPSSGSRKIDWRSLQGRNGRGPDDRARIPVRRTVEPGRGAGLGTVLTGPPHHPRRRYRPPTPASPAKTIRSIWTTISPAPRASPGGSPTAFQPRADRRPEGRARLLRPLVIASLGWDEVRFRRPARTPATRFICGWSTSPAARPRGPDGGLRPNGGAHGQIRWQRGGARRPPCHPAEPPVNGSRPP